MLTDTAKQALKENAERLKATPSDTFTIDPNPDESGSDEYKLALGEKRALAAKNYLLSLGVNAERLSIISYGEESHLDPSQTEAAWAKSRREEFKVKR